MYGCLKSASATKQKQDMPYNQQHCDEEVDVTVFFFQTCQILKDKNLSPIPFEYFYEPFSLHWC